MSLKLRTKQSRHKAEIIRLDQEKQQDPTISNYMLSKEIHVKLKDTNMLKIKGWKQIFHSNSNHRKAILITNKIDFKLKNVIRDRDIYNEKRVNTSRKEYNYYKDIHIQLLSPKIHKVKTGL